MVKPTGRKDGGPLNTREDNAERAFRKFSTVGTVCCKNQGLMSKRSPLRINFRPNILMAMISHCCAF